MREILNTEDVIDSRDVIDRIEELESDREDCETDDDRAEFDEEFGDELRGLVALRDECEGSGDWKYGETLIRDSYFEDYAQELAEDCGMIKRDFQWPYTCIDWEQAARELQQDYMSVDFGGVTYWMRA